MSQTQTHPICTGVGHVFDLRLLRRSLRLNMKLCPQQFSNVDFVRRETKFIPSVEFRYCSFWHIQDKCATSGNKPTSNPRNVLGWFKAMLQDPHGNRGVYAQSRVSHHVVLAR